MWEDVEIVTLDQAKQHLRIVGTTAHDDDLELKLAQAHDIVLNHVKRLSDTDWTATMLAWDPESAPPQIQAAILRMAADLYEFRGDNEDDYRANGNYLPPRVQQLLNEYRECVLA